MGNSAVITTADKKIGVYLYWNGGRDSVEGFLTYCKIRGFRSPETDSYGWARLCQICANFFGPDGLFIGISTNTDGSWCDNGTYIIENWKIVGRENYERPEQDSFELLDMLEVIDEAQPKEHQIGKEEIKKLLENINV